jgi:hypothetical protein
MKSDLRGEGEETHSMLLSFKTKINQQQVISQLFHETALNCELTSPRLSARAVLRQYSQESFGFNCLSARFFADASGS